MPIVPPLTPGPSNAELMAQRHNTQAFILANPVFVELIPRQSLKTGTGVRWVDEAARPMQVARLIDLGTTLVTNSSDGQQERSDFQMLLPHDGEVGENDYWIDDTGKRYEVDSILPHNGYEIRVSVVSYG